jgi:hypothetical protein
MADPAPPRALLVGFVREPEIDLLARAAAALRARLPQAQIVGLAPRSLASLLAAVPVDGWLWQEQALGAGGLVTRLRAARFAWACIAYSGGGPLGSLKLELVALLSGAPRLLAWRRGRLQRLGRAHLAALALAKSALLCSLALFGVLASLVAGALLFSAGRRRARPV